MYTFKKQIKVERFNVPIAEVDSFVSVKFTENHLLEAILLYQNLIKNVPRQQQ